MGVHLLVELQDVRALFHLGVRPPVFGHGLLLELHQSESSLMETPGTPFPRIMYCDIGAATLVHLLKAELSVNEYTHELYLAMEYLVVNSCAIIFLARANHVTHRTLLSFALHLLEMLVIFYVSTYTELEFSKQM